MLRVRMYGAHKPPWAKKGDAGRPRQFACRIFTCDLCLLSCLCLFIRKNSCFCLSIIQLWEIASVETGWMYTAVLPGSWVPVFVFRCSPTSAIESACLRLSTQTCFKYSIAIYCHAGMTRLVCNFSVLTFCDTNKKATFCMAKVLAFYGHLKTSQLATSVNTSEAFGAPISSSFQGKRWAFSSTVSNCRQLTGPGSKPHQTDYSEWVF